MKLNLIDQVIKEPLGGAHRDPAAAGAVLEKYVVDSLRELKRFKLDTVLRKRYERIRSAASFFETARTKARAATRTSKRAPSVASTSRRAVLTDYTESVPSAKRSTPIAEK